MSQAAIRVETPYGTFERARSTLSDGEVLVHDWFVAGEDPELVLSAVEAAEVPTLASRLEPYVGDPAGWRRRATDAVVAQFSEEEPTRDEFDEAADDLALQTVEVLASGEVVLHLDDTCGEHFPGGYWPAVHFDAAGGVTQVTVEA